MALERDDTCRHFMDGVVFDRCLLMYTGYHSTYAKTWEVPVYAADLPGNTNPSHDQIIAVGDPRATALYNSWLATLPDASSEDSSSGLGGVVVP